MTTITVPKSEYQQLKRQAYAYRRFAAQVLESPLRDPIEEVVEDFKKTDFYTEEFLKDLESGLRSSSYLKQHENKISGRKYQKDPARPRTY